MSARVLHRSFEIASLAVALVSSSARAGGDEVLDDDAVRRMLQERLALSGAGAISAALIDGERVRFVAVGASGEPARPFVDEDTVFDIGSVTKTFTALLLADSVARGEVSLDDRLDRTLGDRTGTRDDGAGAATLRELATHTSGLPRVPIDWKIGGRLFLSIRDPYRDVTAADLDRWLSGFRRPAKREHQYSNLGFALLASALERASGKSFADLVRERIAEPLGLRSTFVDLPPELAARKATGHNAVGDVAPDWAKGQFAGAGAVQSTARDLAAYLVAHRDLRSPVRAAVFEPLVPMPPTRWNGLAWVLESKTDGVAWHNGGTGGFNSFVGLDRKTGVGVVVLSSAGQDVTDLGLHLISRKYRLWKGRSVPFVVAGVGYLALVCGAALAAATKGRWRVPWRRGSPVKPVARLDLLAAALNPVVLLALGWYVAPWEAIGGRIARLAALLVTVAALAVVVVRLRGGPWITGTTRERISLIVGLAWSVALLVVVMRW